MVASTLEERLIALEHEVARLRTRVEGEGLKTIEKIGTKDLSIPAITIIINTILITRNTRDFAKVPGLQSEDWTVATS